MKYNFKALRKRVEAIEGGYTTVSRKLGVSRQRLITILGGETTPRFETMKRLSESLKSLESDMETAKEEYADIFLP